MKTQISITFLLVSLQKLCLAYFVTVEPDSSECFFDRVKTATKVGLTFEVIEGGFMDIDVQVCSLVAMCFKQLIDVRFFLFTWFLADVQQFGRSFCC